MKPNITYNANETYQVGNSTRSGKYMIQEYYKNYAKNAYNFITDTNWLRLRSISLSYDFKDLLKKQNIIKGLTATITGTNLLFGQTTRVWIPKHAFQVPVQVVPVLQVSTIAVFRPQPACRLALILHSNNRFKKIRV